MGTGYTYGIEVNPKPPLDFDTGQYNLNKNMHNVVTYMAVLLFLLYLMMLKYGDKKTRDFTQVKSDADGAPVDDGESFERELLDIALTQTAIGQARMKKKEVKKKKKR